MAEKREPAGGLGPLRLKRLLRAAYYYDERLLGVPADTAETAPLRDLVAEIARAIRVGVPEQLLVSPYGEIAISGDATTGITLYVGLPLAMGLPAAELKAVLAHAMTSLGEPHPALADALVRITRNVQNAVEVLGPTTPLGRRYRRFLDHSAGFRADIGRRADRAAAAMAGSQEQARNALARSRAVAEHFAEYAPHYLVDGSEPLQDLYTNWLRAAAQPVPEWAVQSRLPVNPPIPPERDPLIAALADDDNDTLVSAIDIDPDDAVGIDYGAEYHRAMTAAGVLLGRDATPADVVGLVADGRGAEFAEEWDNVTTEYFAALSAGSLAVERFLAATGKSVSTLCEALETFVAGLAVQRGYHYDKVLRPGVLTAEHLPEIEIYETITGAAGGDTAALAGLVTRLVGGAAIPQD